MSRILLLQRSFVAFIFILFPAHLYAEEKSISFDEFLGIALKESPLVQEIEATLAEEEGSGIARTTMTNPVLYGEVRPYTHGAEGRKDEYEVGIEQPLRISDISARSRVADLISSVSGVERKLRLKEFEQTLLLAFGKSWVLSEKVRFTTELVQRTKRFATKMDDGELKGVFPGSTLKILEAERKKLSIELSAVQGEANRSRAELSRMSGVSLAGKTLKRPETKALPAQISVEGGTTIPLIERLKLRSELGSAQARLAELDRYPRFTPRIAFERTSDDDERILVGLSFELPFSDRNQGERLSAQAQSRLHQSRLQYAESGKLNEELSLLLNSVKSTGVFAQSIHNEVLPLVDQALQAVEREVQAGQGSPFQIWQLLRETRELQDSYLEQYSKALSERVELSILSGESL